MNTDKCLRGKCKVCGNENAPLSCATEWFKQCIAKFAMADARAVNKQGIRQDMAREGIPIGGSRHE